MLDRKELVFRFDAHQLRKGQIIQCSQRLIKQGIMMRILSLVFVLAIALAPMAAQAHSGGTDSNGCHAGSKPYHCH
ncbi:MAG: YHYH domain-containing protein [Pseudomonadota bacterium]